MELKRYTCHLNYWRVSLNKILQKLFSLSTPTDQQWVSALEHVPINIIDDINRELMLPFFGDEVYQAVMKMHPTKAPGLDGLPLISSRPLGVVGSQVIFTCLLCFK